MIDPIPEVVPIRLNIPVISTRWLCDTFFVATLRDHKYFSKSLSRIDLHQVGEKILRKKLRRPRKTSEHTIQSKLVGMLPELMKREVVRMAIPNGELRHPRTALKLRAEGVLPGAPDLVFALDNGATVWLEMKKPGGVVRDSQLGVHAKLQRLGHIVGVCDSIDAALDFLRSNGVLKND